MLRKLSDLDANDILIRTTIDEIPEGYRDEVWVEEENGEVIDTYFIGVAGAVSYSGTTLALKEWKGKNEA